MVQPRFYKHLKGTNRGSTAKQLPTIVGPILERHPSWVYNQIST
jgi:hypothetical protein